MKQVSIYGASDDLIEVDGDVSEEFVYSIGRNDAPDLLAFSDGTLLSIEYTNGCWRISRLAIGDAEYSHTPAVNADEENYSDRVTLTRHTDEPWWVVHANAEHGNPVWAVTK